MDGLNQDLRRIQHGMTTERPSDTQERLAMARLRHSRGRKIRHVKPNIGQKASSLRRKFVPKRLPMVSRIKAYWMEIIGANYAQYCEPLKLTGGKLDKTLHIRVSPAMAVLIQHEEKAILARLETMAGGRVNRLKLHQGQIVPFASTEKNKRGAKKLSDEDKELVTESAARISDPKLRAAIENLGTSVLSSKSV